MAEETKCTLCVNNGEAKVEYIEENGHLASVLRRWCLAGLKVADNEIVIWCNKYKT